jgi:hypothetical protein
MCGYTRCWTRRCTSGLLSLEAAITERLRRRIRTDFGEWRSSQRTSSHETKTASASSLPLSAVLAGSADSQPPDRVLAHRLARPSRRRANRSCGIGRGRSRMSWVTRHAFPGQQGLRDQRHGPRRGARCSRRQYRHTAPLPNATDCAVGISRTWTRNAYLLLWAG